MTDSARYYDEHADEFYALSVGADMTALHDAFLAHLPPGARILDAGCGSGRDSRAFLDRGFRVTALDASAAMVARASALLDQPVLHLRFEDLAFDEAFDGIWACASLLHVPRAEMPTVLDRLARALVPRGVLFASFKWGDGEVVRDGRLFTSYTPGSFIHLLAALSVPLAIINVWQTEDVRPGRAGEDWLDALLRKG